MSAPRSWPFGLPTALTFEHGNQTVLPVRFADGDVRFSEQLVSFFVERLTGPGDAVLDPFAGFGTTLVVAESLGREAFGVELDPDRAAYTRSRVRAPDRLFTGDARDLDALPIPPVRLAITSPPYSSPGDPGEALSAYRDPNPGYDRYLADLQTVCRSVGSLLTPGGWLVVEAANLRRPDRVDTLAWDIARAVGDVLPFAGEIAVRWEPTYGYGYYHSYCLLFSPPAG
jgi:SAM-dependent methyltransferase